MSIQYIFFDLDGTLLPMDQDRFIAGYFQSLISYMQDSGLDPQIFKQAIQQGIGAMIRNNGSKTNEEVFWEVLTGIYGKEILEYTPVFDAFYRDRFPLIQQICGYDPEVPKMISRLKDSGYRLVLATQPAFPAVATEARMKWAGLSKEDFILYTTYENSSFCKPNPEYYRQILEKLGARAEECLMVGNDAQEDMVAETLGMKVYLLTRCLVNRRNVDLSAYPQGDLNTLMDYIQSM